MSSTTPPQLHARVYKQAIEPLAQPQPLDYIRLTENWSADILEDLLTPADLTTHPSTFGPLEDPVESVLRVAQSIDMHAATAEVLDGSEGRHALRKAYDDLKRHEKRLAVDIMRTQEGSLHRHCQADSAVHPVPQYMRSFSPVLSAAAIREGKAATQKPQQLHSAADLFGSRTLSLGSLAVESFKPPKITASEAL